MKPAVIIFFLVGLLAGNGFAQKPELPRNTISRMKDYRASVLQDSLKKMCNLAEAVPGIVFDLRYSTRNNFTGKILYPWARTSFMRVEPAKALFRIQAFLKQKGFGIKVFDAYRPWSATYAMWELVKDERYAANPAKGSNHNRGLAIDLTLVNLATGRELNMGTGFDHFSDTAHHNFTGLNNEILLNRKLLKEVMEREGFKALDTEWWHYSWPDNRQYEILNIALKTMARKQ